MQLLTTLHMIQQSFGSGDSNGESKTAHLCATAAGDEGGEGHQAGLRSALSGRGVAWQGGGLSRRLLLLFCPAWLPALLRLLQHTPVSSMHAAAEDSGGGPEARPE